MVVSRLASFYISADQNSFVPETKGVALEDIDQLFGGTSHREAGEAMEQHDDKAQTGEFDENVEKGDGVKNVVSSTQK
jgi:hypothetical protein